MSAALGVRAMTASDAAAPASAWPRQVVALKAAPQSQHRHRVVTSAESPAAERWRHVLERLSRVRSVAWRRDDPQLLRRVYDPAASALVKDQRRLRRYADRGLSVRGARLEFGPVRVLRRTPGVVQLRVIDQLRPAVAVGPNGQRFELPHDRPTRHSLVLHRRAGRWRIAEVRVR